MPIPVFFKCWIVSSFSVGSDDVETNIKFYFKIQPRIKKFAEEKFWRNSFSSFVAIRQNNSSKDFFYRRIPFRTKKTTDYFYFETKI